MRAPIETYQRGWGERERERERERGGREASKKNRVVNVGGRA